MALFKSLIWTGGKATGTGITGRKKRKIKAKLYSAYVLGVDQIERLTVSLASVYSLATVPT